MKVTVIPIVIGALCTINKGLEQGPVGLEIRGVETIQTTALLRSVRINRKGHRNEVNESMDSYQ